MRWDPIQGMFRVYEGGSGGGPTTTTSTTQNFSPEEAAARAKVQAEAARIYGENAAALQWTPYPGSRPTDLSSATREAEASWVNFARGGATDQANQAAAYSSWLMGPAQYAESNPYLQSAITAATRPITEAYSGAGGALSQIRSGAGSAGQYGSTRQGIAEGLTTQGYLRSVGDTGAKMANENYQVAQAAGLKALGLAPQVQQMGTLPGQLIGSVGSLEDTQAQALEDYRANAAMWEINAPWAPLQNYANIVFGGSNPGTSSTSTGGGYKSNPFASGIGLAAQGAMLGSMVMPGVGTAVGAGAGLLAGLFS